MSGMFIGVNEYEQWATTAGIMSSVVFFFQAEDGIRDLVRSRGLGDVYKRQFQPIEAHYRALKKSK